MIQIKLTRSDVDHRWSVSLLDQEKVFWISPETFDSADIAYYRAIGTSSKNAMAATRILQKTRS